MMLLVLCLSKEMGGGSGLKYAASSIVYLSKEKKKMEQKS